MSEQKINCRVHTCRHHDHSDACMLGSITVGCTESAPHQCAETECDSFEER